MRKENRKALIQLMEQYRINSNEAAELLGMKVTSIHTFRSTGSRDITSNDLELLEFKLAAKYDR